MVAHIGNVPLLGVPACGLHHRITVLDLVLPRILAGERIGKKGVGLSRTWGAVQGLRSVFLSALPVRKMRLTPLHS